MNTEKLFRLNSAESEIFVELQLVLSNRLTELIFFLLFSASLVAFWRFSMVTTFSQMLSALFILSAFAYSPTVPTLPALFGRVPGQLSFVLFHQVVEVTMTGIFIQRWAWDIGEVQASPIIPIRIRQGIIQIQGWQTIIRPIIRIAADAKE